jgi:DNA-binding transcriptional LysR family regulator
VLALPHFHAVALAVARGRLIAALPEPLAKFVVAAGLQLDLFKPPVPLPARELYMHWHKRHDQNPAHRWLREQIAGCRASIT